MYIERSKDIYDIGFLLSDFNTLINYNCVIVYITPLDLITEYA